jgi:hypothetical protein
MRAVFRMSSPFGIRHARFEPHSDECRAAAHSRAVPRAAKPQVKDLKFRCFITELV